MGTGGSVSRRGSAEPAARFISREDPQEPQLTHLPYQGEALSVLAAVLWAVAVVLFKLSGKKLAPFALNLFKNTVGLFLFLVTLAVLRQDFLYPAPLADYVLLALSGVVGLAIADTLFLKSLNIVGAGLSQVVGCVYSPWVVLFSLMFLGEKLSIGDLAGACMILSGVFLSSRHDPPPGTTRRELRRGVALGVIAFALMAAGVVLAKPALNRSPVLWSTTVRLASGVVALSLISLSSPRRRAAWRAFRPSASWKLIVPASFVGTYLAMAVWLAGVKYTQATTASILNQSSAIFVLPLAGLILKESITAKKIGAVVLALSGVVLVTLA